MNHGILVNFFRESAAKHIRNLKCTSNNSFGNLIQHFLICVHLIFICGKMYFQVCRCDNCRARSSTSTWCSSTRR